MSGGGRRGGPGPAGSRRHDGLAFGPDLELLAGRKGPPSVGTALPTLTRMIRSCAASAPAAGADGVRSAGPGLEWPAHAGRTSVIKAGAAAVPNRAVDPDGSASQALRLAGLRATTPRRAMLAWLTWHPHSTADAIATGGQQLARPGQAGTMVREVMDEAYLAAVRQPATLARVRGAGLLGAIARAATHGANERTSVPAATTAGMDYWVDVRR